MKYSHSLKSSPKKSVSPGKSQIRNSIKCMTPKKKQIKSKQYFLINQEGTQKVRKIRQKLCNQVGVYTLLFQTLNPLRCLVHNSTISMYCQTEQKLLCTSCVYNNSQHRLHKIVPVSQSWQKIKRDATQLLRQAEREAKSFKEFQQKVMKLMQDEEKEVFEKLALIQQKIGQLKEHINRKFIFLRQKLRKQIRDKGESEDIFMLQVKQIERCFKMVKCEKQELMSDDECCYWHLMCQSVLNCGTKQLCQLQLKIDSETRKPLVQAIDKISKQIQKVRSEFL